MYSTYGNYGTYNYTTTTAAPAAGAMAFGVMVFMAILVIICVALAVLAIIANWKVFKKMGMEGWKSLIPGANTYLVCEKIGVSQKWLVVITFSSAIAAIPFIGWLAEAAVIIYFAILYSVSLAKAFGKSTGFAIGLILVYPIFLLILAFSKDTKYIGADPMNDIIFKK